MATRRTTSLGPHGDKCAAILDSLDDGIVTLDDAGTVIGINDAACRMLETTRKSALGAACFCLFGEELCTPGSALRESISNRKPIHDVEVELETASGHRKVFNFRTVVFREQRGEPRGGLVVLRDITELVHLRRDLKERYRLHNIIGKSKAMQDVFRLIEQVADTDTTVLIQGPTGTGKELVARAIHYVGTRAKGPFVAVSCSALPESLLESELFGHVRGAFTGALRDKQGRFEAAAGGTIFLDEVGDISANIQAKLLRVLQEHTIDRVGGERSIPVDMRVIAATNRPLGELVAAGQFREDLYYRLRVVPIRLPPLKERREDIALLTQHFVDKLRREMRRDIEGLDPEALALLLDYSWPGNVRELENTIEYAFVKTHSGRVSPAHLPPQLIARELAEAPVYVDSSAPRKRRRRRLDLTRAQVREALIATGWNVAKAARLLQVSRTTLYSRMSEFELATPDE